MVREHTMVNIDLEIKHMAKKLGINMSKVLEDTLKAMVNSNSEDHKQLNDLVDELDHVKDLKKDLAIKECSLLTKIEAIRIKTNKEQTENDKKKMAMTQALKDSGVFRQMVEDD